MHYYQFHIGDYRAATAHLSNEEDLAYRRLLDMYYDTEQKIPVDTQWVSRRLRIKRNVIQAVLEDFFVLTDEGWVHDKCEEVIVHYHENVNKNRQNGRLGGRPKKTQSVSIGIPVATQQEPNQKATNNHKPVTSKPEEKTNTPIAAKAARVSVSDESFDRFWEAYDYKLGRHKALKAWQSINPDAELAEKIIAAALIYNKANPSRAYYKHATTWLNGRNWEDNPDDLLPKIARQHQPQMTHHQATTLAAARTIFGDERNLSNDQRIIDVTPNQAPAGLLGSADF